MGPAEPPIFGLKMKTNRPFWFIGFSFLALVVLLLIQLRWIWQMAEMKEALFNEKANMVLARTVEAVNKDTKTCQRIDACMGAGSATDPSSLLGNREKQVIDSLFQHYMAFYKLNVGYTFSVARAAPSQTAAGHQFSSLLFDHTAPGSLQVNQGTALKLILPDKRDFILAEMGPVFFVSVALILVVMGLFWQTGQALLQEKRIAAHTANFVNNMTHELRTPLTNIALAGKMLHKETRRRQEPKLEHYSTIILEENEKLRLQVEQMLGMSALERGEMVIKQEEVDLHQVISQVGNAFRLQLEHAEGILRIDLQAAHYSALGDATHLQNAVSNLVSNAIQYAGGKPSISITTTNTGSWLHIAVRDQGIGIDTTYHQKIFEKFFRVPTGNVHNVKGFGLGLAYVQQVAVLHGGTILLHSEKGKGATFTLSIPYA